LISANKSLDTVKVSHQIWQTLQIPVFQDDSK